MVFNKKKKFQYHKIVIESYQGFFNPQFDHSATESIRPNRWYYNTKQHIQSQIFFEKEKINNTTGQSDAKMDVRGERLYINVWKRIA